MKAIVCDKCGKVTLLEDNRPFMYTPAGVYRLVSDVGDKEIELCEDCAGELIEAVRKTREEE